MSRRIDITVSSIGMEMIQIILSVLFKITPDFWLQLMGHSIDHELLIPRYQLMMSLHSSMLISRKSSVSRSFRSTRRL